MTSNSEAAGATLEAAAADHVAPTDARRHESSRRAFITFVVMCAAAVVLLLWIGRSRWFTIDDGDFLATRSTTDLHDLFAPHNNHWSTLPLLVYRSLWTIVGVRSYLPYELISISLHVAIAAMLRLVMRRAGVRPWTATCVAGLFLLYGAGRQSIEVAFTMNLSAAVVFGLTHLVLADHDGPVDRRDALGLLAGFAGLLCSGVAVTMVVVVGIATLTRRGWRAAAIHVMPLLVTYLIWFTAIGSTGYSDGPTGSVSRLPDFVRTEATATFRGIAHLPGATALVIAMLAVGLTLAWRHLPLSDARHDAAAPLACLVGSLTFLVIAGAGRSDTFETGGVPPTRYVHIATALLLPAIAVAADAIIRRWRVMTPVLAAVLIVSLIGNVRDFPSDASNRELTHYGEYLFTLPRLPLARAIPRELHPESRTPSISMGWLIDAVDAGRAPAAVAVDPVDAATWELTLALRREIDHKPTLCGVPVESGDIEPATGASIKALAGVEVTYTNAAGVRSRPTVYEANTVAPFLVAYAGPLALHVSVLNAGDTFFVCDPSGAPLTVPKAVDD